MWKRELLKNKLYALLLVGLSLPVMFLDGDATATVLMLFFAVPLFFAKENWIMGGSQSHACQESRRKGVRRHTYRGGEKSDGYRDPEGACGVRQKTHRRNRRDHSVGCCMNSSGSGLSGFGLITMPSMTVSRSWSVGMRWKTRMIFGSVRRMLKRIGVDIEAWHKGERPWDLMLLEEWCGTFAWFEQCCSMIWRRILIFHRPRLSAIEMREENLSQIGSSPNCKEKYGISDMHAQSLIKFMNERG